MTALVTSELASGVTVRDVYVRTGMSSLSLVRTLSSNLQVGQ